ncbi:DUF3893 domain-containing protein [Oscillatoria sp. FACHB-1407]|uniref:RNaseH domain-containing protein n=1 Tax=Oscillatoria sp. FACHB-1407 TaxID=2692847 RepID=UPI001685EE2B|nr:RNaseH domain-containing protein [Oscillatoria sp. FACHB-1407]MBD2463383.1 DUF3893 domain-containing protein [Oscillatoria sp. FACHB-1407]
MYNEIRLLSLRLKNPSAVQQTYSCLKFPKDAVANLKTLSAIRDNRTENTVNLPSTSLVHAVRACIPDIASILPGLGLTGGRNSDGWIFSSAPISTPYFSVFFRHWLNVEYPSENLRGDCREEQLKNGAIAAFTPDALEKLTGEVILDAAQWGQWENGTAKLDSLTFNLLPDFLATQLTAPGLRFKLQGEWIRFYRCSSKEGQAELISFPPLKTSLGKQEADFYYSMAITIEVETVPFQAEPEARFNISVRRWVSSEVKKIVGNHAVSVYFRNPLAWGKAIDSGKNTGYFQVAPLIWRGDYHWDSNLLPLLEQFNPLSLKPAEICADPVKALNLKGDRNIALTHADGIYPAHRVGKGWFTEDCRQITEQIIELLQDDWAPINYLRVAVPKIAKSSATPYQSPRPSKNSWDATPPKRRKDEDDAAYQKRAEKVGKQKYHKRLIEAKRLREGIVACVGKHLVLEIWYQNTSSRDACTQAVWFNLGQELLEADTSQNYPDGVVVDTCYFREEDLTVTLLKIEARGIPSALALKSDKKPNEREILAAFKRRQEDISQRIRELPEVPKISERGAILEIAGQDQWEKSWLDPYRICRAAFASEGRLLQYITQEHERVPKNEGDKIGIARAKETLNSRATSSVQDVLRALGVQAVPPKIVLKGATLPDPLVYVGVWLVNRTSETTINGKGLQLPIAVMLRSDSNQVWITYPGAMQNGSIWLPYSTGQLEIASGITPIAAETAPEKRKALQKSVTDFLANVLQSKEIRRNQSLITFDACNFRQALPWLQDRNLIKDALQMGDAPPKTPDKLRIVRIREGEETPDWYGMHSKAKDLIPIFDQTKEFPKASEMVQGLFWSGTNDRVFLSIAQKASTMPALRGGYSKLDRPETSWSSPQAVELTMAHLQPNDEPSHWAFLAHQLRSYSLAYNDNLVYPIMLNLARQASDYALLVK